MSRFVGKSDRDANALMSCTVILWLIRRKGTGLRFIHQRRREYRSMMPTSNTQESPERELTDISLREEREKADREMTANRAATEEHADAAFAA
jgi:hypothetical protein